MSVDYTAYQEGVVASLENLVGALIGDYGEKDVDHSYQVLSIIPVLLKSRISLDMRTLLLRQYIEIQAHTRDMQLGELSRSDFYSFAAQETAKELEHRKLLLAESNLEYEHLKGFLDADNKADIDKIDSDHEILKKELANVIKSEIGIPVDGIVGPQEIIEFLRSNTSTLA